MVLRQSLATVFPCRLGVLLFWDALVGTKGLDVLGGLGDVLCNPTLVNNVVQGDEPGVLQLAVAGEVLDCTAYSSGLLHVALRLGRADCALQLAQRYSNRSWQLFFRDVGTNITALLLAAKQGSAAVVEALLEHGVPTDNRDAAGNSVLHLAAAAGSSATVQVVTARLENPGPLLLSINDAGEMPLHSALNRGSSMDIAALELVKAAAAHSAGLAEAVAVAVNSYGNTPLHLCQEPSVFQLLLAHRANLTARNADGALAFHTLARSNSTAASGTLGLAAASSPQVDDARDTLGRTPLHYAAMSGSLSSAQWLIDRGADTTAVDNNGQDALALGLQNGHDYLIATFQAEGKTPPLASAIAVGSFELLQHLVLNESVPVVTIDSRTGRSAIFAAVQSGRDDMVGFLLAQGENVDRKDNSGLSLLAVAVLAQKPLTAEFLLSSGASADLVLANGSTALHVAAATSALPEAKVLLTRDANVDAADFIGRTPLHVAATAAMATLLLQHGASPLETVTGLLPLHSAAIAGNVEVMEVLLLWRHLDLDAQSFNGDTALHCAAQAGSRDAVALLLRWCASTRVVNAAGFRAADDAGGVGPLADLILDADLAPGRCECDCGLYAPGPLFLTSAWTSGCAARVSCQLGAAVGASSEIVRCAPQQVSSDSSTIKSAWQPQQPTLRCRGAAVTGSSASITPCLTLVTACAFLLRP